MVGFGQRSERWRGVPGLVLACVWIGAACGCSDGREGAAGDDRLKTAVSIPPQEWLVKQVGGDRVEVVSLLPPGSTPATYQPTDAEVSRVMQSALYFRIGVPFEWGSWFEAIERSGRPRVVDIREGIELQGMDSHPSHTGDKGRVDSPREAHRHNGKPGKDTHIWLSPELLRRQARIVCEALAEQDPAHADGYQRNFRRVEEELEALDRELAEMLAPYQGKPFLVFHPAWGYFARAYGLRQIAMEVEGKEPTDRELTLLQREAQRNGIRVVFVSKEVSARAAKAMASVIGGRVERLDPLGTDIPETLRRAAAAIAGSYKEDAS